VPGSSCLAVVWMAGCGQRDVGVVEGEMAAPGREDVQTTANGSAATQGAEGPGGGRGEVPMVAGVGFLHCNMSILHTLKPQASTDLPEVVGARCGFGPPGNARPKFPASGNG